jgi:hypothetical protein
MFKTAPAPVLHAAPEQTAAEKPAEKPAEPEVPKVQDESAPKATSEAKQEPKQKSAQRTPQVIQQQESNEAPKTADEAKRSFMSLFEDGTATEFWDRDVSPNEAKILAGAVVGYVEKRITGAIDKKYNISNLLMINRFLAHLEQFDDCYPDKMTDDTIASCEDWHQKNKEFKAAAKQTFTEMKEAIKRPDIALMRKAIESGEALMQTMQDSKEHPFAAGRDLGKGLRKKEKFAQDYITSNFKPPKKLNPRQATEKSLKDTRTFLESVDKRNNDVKRVAPELR